MTAPLKLLEKLKNISSDYHNDPEDFNVSDKNAIIFKSIYDPNGSKRDFYAIFFVQKNYKGSQILDY
jgi:hypothetical protein